MAGIAAVERLGRSIGAMRIVKVNPKKEGPAGMRIQPGKRPIHGLVTAALGQRGARLRAGRGAGGIIEDLKAAVESPHRVEYERTDEGRGLITIPAQNLGDCRYI